MDDPRPAGRVLVTVNGAKWELVPTDKLLWPETIEVKKVSGLSMFELGEGIAKSDPFAWLAWMYVSIKRQWPSLTYEELEESLKAVTFAEILNSVEREGEADGDPPASPPENGSDAQPNGGGSGETTPLRSTLETAGQRI